MFALVTHHTSRLLGAAHVLLTVARVSGALDRGVRPDERDLKRLGFARDALKRLS